MEKFLSIFDAMSQWVLQTTTTEREVWCSPLCKNDKTTIDC